MYDTLTSSKNTSLWYCTEKNCKLCDFQNPSLQHIFSSCKSALTQGRYKSRHKLVLRKNHWHPRDTQVWSEHVQQVSITWGTHPLYQTARLRPVEHSAVVTWLWSLMASVAEWNLMTDLNQQLRFPQEITTTSLRVCNIALVIPQQDGLHGRVDRPVWREYYGCLLEEEGKVCRAGSCTLLSEMEDNSHSPWKLRSRGYTGSSAQCLFKTLGIKDAKLKRATREIAEVLQQGSFSLWLRGKDIMWGKQRSEADCR